MRIIPAAIALLVLLAIGAGLILLQIFLSKKENKWLGLILPIIALCISLLAVFSIAAYTRVPASTGGVVVRDENGVIIQEATPEQSTTIQIQDTPSTIFMVVSVFLLYNIPTIVLLAIYFACREHQRRRKALQKMQAQDLG